MKLWAVMWRSKNRLEGLREHLLQYKYTNVEGSLPALFCTRRVARKWIIDNFVYIKRRSDLRAEPHGWRMPRPVRVTITPNASLEPRGGAA